MKDSLKDFVGKNRKMFDDKEVPEGTWPGIETSLPAAKQRTLWDHLSVWRAAAAILLGLSIYLYANPRKQEVPREVTVAPADLTDFESFYSGQIAEKIALIDEFDPADETDAFTQDLKRLDIMYQVLREEMKAHPSQKIKDAMVLNMLVRVDLLNLQIKKLEDSRKPGRKSSVSAS